jgi:NAD+ kinase
MTVYKRVGITVKSGLDFTQETLQKMRGILDALGCTTFLDSKRLTGIPESASFQLYSSENEIDLLIVVGGDGTVLRAIREMTIFEKPILSVNRGTIGFLAELELDELENELPAMLNGDGFIEERSILSVSLQRNSEIIHNGFALNEAVIAQGTIARLIDLETTVNGETLTAFHADGLIISTPTGSTAYALAAGGPIVHPLLPAIILTPSNPHSFSQKPLVIPSEYTVAVTVRAQPNKFKDTEVVLTLDGQMYIPLRHKDVLRVCACDKTVKFLRRKQDTFFQTLRKKLKWGE